MRGGSSLRDWSWKARTLSEERYRRVTSIALRYLTFLIVIGALVLAFLIFFYPSVFFGGPWRTQVIEFRDRKDPSHRIEYQMQDLGAFGYGQRTVEVIPVLYFWETTHEVDTTVSARTDWMPVNEEVNELGIKYP